MILKIQRIPGLSRECVLPFGESLLPDVIKNTNTIMEGKYQEYKNRTDPYIYSELERLYALKEKHKEVQLTIFDVLGQERKKSEKETNEFKPSGLPDELIEILNNI